MTWWSDFFNEPKPVELTEQAKATTRTPEFQSAWSGWNVNPPTSTVYNPNTTTLPQGNNAQLSPYAALLAALGGGTGVMAQTENQKVLAEQELKDFYFKQWQAGVPNVPGYTTSYAPPLSPFQQQSLAAQQQQSWQTVSYQQQQLAAEQQYRQQQLQQEQQQRLATLAANPKSWLEYAATANQQPVIQPWMLPLMPQDYSGVGMPQAGQTIPGWNPQNMQSMPNLINPSAQLWARMGPTAQQQYYGYQQADQAMMPEESQFRMWNMAPPRGAMSFNQVR